MESDSAMLRRIVKTRKFEKLDPERLLELADKLEKQSLTEFNSKRAGKGK